MTQWIGVSLMLTSAFFSALGALFLKFASDGKIGFNPFLLIKNKKLLTGISFYALSTAIAMPAYKFAEITIIYPMIATSYIWVSLLSIKYLKERMNIYKWMGIFLIICGVISIGLS